MALCVIIKGFWQHPMVLITNLEASSNDSKAIDYIVEVYLTRWKCDEYYRYINQSYNPEDVRVRSNTAIRNTVALVHAIAYFTCVYMGLSLKLKVVVQKIFILSKRFFGVPAFFQYAMADGICELLKKARTGIEEIKFKGKLAIRQTIFIKACFQNKIKRKLQQWLILFAHNQLIRNEP